jgi:diguanylate cyclase (GGDEF)-like protein
MGYRGNYPTGCANPCTSKLGRQGLHDGLTMWELAPQPTVRDVISSNGASGHDFEAIVDSLDEGVLVFRTDGHLKYINPAAMAIYGFRSERDAAEFFEHAATSPCYYADGARVPLEFYPLAFRAGAAFSREIYGVEIPSGERRWLFLSVRPLNPVDPFSDVLVAFSDITEERENFYRLIRRANHDPLTGLPNRAVVLREITKALESPDRGRLRAVLFIDLDDLKTTNDTMGHEAGDRLLNAAAMRLRQSVGPADVVARHGGDEFVVLVCGHAKHHQLNAWVSRLRARLAEPVTIAGTSVPLRASIGVVEVDRDDRRTAEEILRAADRAMYRAKRAGRGH